RVLLGGKNTGRQPGRSGAYDTEIDRCHCHSPLAYFWSTHRMMPVALCARNHKLRHGKGAFHYAKIDARSALIT
ncbi:MAG TPA: hypothetical protein PL109_05885, partial [Nitrospira sp.]|nr:hypothetical protein [Nitrospira sp.]